MAEKDLIGRENLIIVFSKDRPDRLGITLPHMPTKENAVLLLDDSSLLENQKQIRKLCNQFGLIYHGRVEQHDLFNKINCPALSYFVTDLGKRGWSLGFNRNYSIIYGLYLGAKRLLFMDDDIIPKESRQIADIFRALQTVPFVGTEITRMPDDSIVGHLYRAGNKVLPRYVSGGFLGIDLEKVQYCFLNIYNEDWIWLSLENNGGVVSKIGSVDQLNFDPYENWETKIEFQEFGSLFWEGIRRITPIRFKELYERSFWEQLLRDRISELEHISELPISESLQPIAQAIRKFLIEFHRTVSPDSLIHQSQEYFCCWDDWRGLIKGLRR